MAIENSYKIRTKGKNLFLRVTKGHFMKTNGHMNYYIDVTMQKSRLSEARAVAEELVSYYNSSAVIDTILCLDEMQVIATCMADLLTKSGFMNLNEHQTIYKPFIQLQNCIYSFLLLKCCGAIKAGYCSHGMKLYLGHIFNLNTNSNLLSA